MELDWKMVVILVEALIIVLLGFAVFKSTPPQVVDLLFTLLAAQAKNTPETVDDEAVATGRAIYDQLKTQATKPAPD